MTLPARCRGGIIAAGDGTRLRAAGFPMPKPLVPIAGVALIEWVIEKRYGPPKQLPPTPEEPTTAPEGKAAEKERASEREPTADERTANPMPEARG